MNKKLLCAALLAGIGCVQAANAQEFDDRWYVTGSVGYNFQDSERMTDDAPFGTIGVGKFLSPNWSIDGELHYQNPNFSDNEDLKDRKSVVSGKSVSVRVDLGGRRIIKKKNNT